MNSFNYIWEQGEDLILNVKYLVETVPQDMTAYDVRMDIAKLENNIPSASIFAFNSTDIPNEPLDAVGTSDNEITTDINGNINIVVSRALTLGAGVIAASLPQTNTFIYDIFIRKISTNTQKKLLSGTITVNRSITQWM